MSTRLHNAATDVQTQSASASKAQPQPPRNSPIKQPAARVVLLLIIVAVFYAGMFRWNHPPTYTASAIVSIPPSSGAPSLRLAQPGRVTTLLEGAETSTTRSADDQLTLAANTLSPDTYTLQATADSPQAAASIANNAAQSIVSQTKILQRLAIRQHTMSVLLATEIAAPEASSATLSSTSPISPQAQTTSLTIIGVLLTVAVIALVISLVPEPRTAGPAKVAVSPRAAAQPKETLPPNAARAESSAKPQEQSQQVPQQSVELAAPATIAFAALDSYGSVSVTLDASLLHRLEEFKTAGVKKGVVFVVSDASAVGTLPADQRLNAAQAALAFAKEIRKSTDLETLLIDCGSTAWSNSRIQTGANQLPLDVMDLPTGGPGVFEILKGSTSIDAWNIAMDDRSGLLSIAPGTVLSRWPEILRSDQMQKFVEDAKTLAQVIVIYGPPCLDRPETVRVLGDWSNGIVLVGASTQAGADAEAHAIEILRNAGAKRFGRIAMQQTT